MNNRYVYNCKYVVLFKYVLNIEHIIFFINKLSKT